MQLDPTTEEPVAYRIVALPEVSQILETALEADFLLADILLMYDLTPEIENRIIAARLKLQQIGHISNLH